MTGAVRAPQSTPPSERHCSGQVVVNFIAQRVGLGRLANLTHELSGLQDEVPADGFVVLRILLEDERQGPVSLPAGFAN